MTDSHSALEDCDPALRPLLGATDEVAESTAIEQLIVAADAVIERVIAHYRHRSILDSHAVDEVLSGVRTRLFLKLRRLRAHDSEPIASLEAYVAGITYNAIHDVFRERHPERVQLRNRLRRIATTNPRFKYESTPVGIVCALRTEKPDAIGRDELTNRLEALLEEARGPMLINEIVTALSEQSAGTLFTFLSEDLEADAPAPLTVLEGRETLEHLWREIEILPPNQRSALLLNLRGKDGEDILSLVILTGVANMDAVAAALSITSEELTEIWNELPLDDLSIAARLRVTRQQVINFRKSARMRLTRRLHR